MTLESYLGFAGGVILLLLLPGPTNTLIMTAGATQPLRRLLLLQLAEISAYSIAISCLLALQAALGDWRMAGAIVLKSAAIAIILLLAAKLWQQRTAIANDSAGVISPKAVFLVTLFNPKSLVFAFAIFPPVQNLSALAIKEMLFAILALVCGWAWIAAGRVLAAGGLRGSRAIPGLAAIALCAFAIYLGSSVLADASGML